MDELKYVAGIWYRDLEVIVVVNYEWGMIVGSLSVPNLNPNRVYRVAGVGASVSVSGRVRIHR